MREKVRQWLIYAGFTIADILILYALFKGGVFVWKAIHGEYSGYTIKMVLLVWGASNLALYQLVGALVDYLWERKNRRNMIVNADYDTRKSFKRRYGITSDEELDKIEYKPSIIKSLLVGSAVASQTIEDYFIDGPHLKYRNDKFTGLIKNRRIFEYAAIQGEAENIKFAFLTFRPKYLPYTVMHNLLYYLGIVFWALIPYVMAFEKHCSVINEFVAEFSPGTAYVLKQNDSTEEDVTVVTKLHDMIWNHRSPEYDKKNPLD